jgi:arginyl-tRNA synthetase
MGYNWAKGIEHISYGMVDLPSGKMKSREGTVVDADDLMKEMRDTAEQISIELGKLSELSEEEKNDHYWNIGLAALKYFILKVDPKKRMLFDPKESIDFNGNTGPFIQYTHARIKSILRKVDFKLEDNISLSENLIEEDFEIIQYLHEFPEVLRESAENKSPALIANYTYELVKLFNHYYQNIPSIVKEEDKEIQNSRLSICYKTSQTIKNSMNLLGINVPEFM